MKNIDLIIVLSLCLSFVGCVTANSIKPSDVKAYKTPNHLIAAKSLFGESDTLVASVNVPIQVQCCGVLLSRSIVVILFKSLINKNI